MVTAPTQLSVSLQQAEREILALDPLLNKIISAPDQFLSDLKAKKSADGAEKDRVITLINHVVTNQLTTVNPLLYQTLYKIVCLCHKILGSDFERKKMCTYDALITAACVADLERKHGSSESIFVDKSVTGTRSLQYCPEKKQVAVIACCGNAKLEEKGSYKRVLSSAILNLADLPQPARSGVLAHVSSLTNDSDNFKDVYNGLNLLRKVTPSPTQGICSVESVVNRYGTVNGVRTVSPVDIKVVFEGYQGDINQIIQDVVIVSDLEKLIIMRDLVRGLIHLHKKDVIHGDLKPANALFCVDGTPQGAKGGLADFDLAFSLEDGGMPSLVFPWGYYGSIYFTDPHHYGKEGSSIKPIEYYKQLDAWALGCVLLQLWKHLLQPPWAAYLNATYCNDFLPNKKTHKDRAALVKNQKLFKESIHSNITKPLRAILGKKRDERSFSEKVKRVLFPLLRVDPQNRMSLAECEGNLTALIDKAMALDAQLKSQNEAADRAYEKSLKELVVGTPQQLNTLVNLVLNKDVGKRCQPLTREGVKKLLAAATEIASESDPHPARDLFDQILKLFKVLQSARFEKKALSVQKAWQLAAYCTIELKSYAKATKPLHISQTYSGLSHDLQFDPRSSLVTIIAARSEALRNIEKETTYKHYKSALSFSLAAPIKAPINTLYMRNAGTLSLEELQTIEKEMRLCEHIKKSLPLDRDMPVLQPLSYRQGGDPAHFKSTGNYNYISAIYPEFKGSLQAIIDGSETVSYHQKLNLAEQLLRKLCCLHQMGVALGDVKGASALFQFTEDDQVKAVWTDLRSAYLVNEPSPEVTWPVAWGSYAAPPATEPQFFGCENVQLTSEDHLRLDAWAFGIMLHEFFIGPIAWKADMSDCFKLIKIDKKKQPNESVQTRLYLTTGRRRIASKIEATIEKPLRKLSAKPDPTKEEQMKLLIWQLLRYKREERITLEKACQLLVSMMEVAL